jgi:hypothetical protein
MSHGHAERPLPAADDTASQHSSPDPAERRLLAAASFFAGDARRIRALTERFKRRGDLIESRVEGGSMSGSLPRGSRIRIACTDRGVHAVGEIVAVLFDGRPIVHRVAYRGHWGGARRYLITRGDAPVLPDMPAEIGAVLGPVIAVDAGAGWRPPPAALPRRRPLLSAALLLAFAVALEIHPRLARVLRRLMWLCTVRAERLARNLARGRRRRLA